MSDEKLPIEKEIPKEQEAIEVTSEEVVSEEKVAGGEASEVIEEQQQVIDEMVTVVEEETDTKDEVEAEAENSVSEATDETALEVQESTKKAQKTPIAEETVDISDDNSLEEEEEEEEEVASSDEEDDDESEAEEHKDYHSLTKKELVAAFDKLLNSKPIQTIKNEVEEIKTEFNAKFAEDLEHKKEEFLSEGGNIIDFHYTTPLKKEFNSLYFDYKEKRNNHYKNLKKDLQANFNRRQELIEELKGLLNAEENINTTYKHFKDIQERWHLAGPIPRDKYNIIWNTYHHHVENFYDFLHLNREFRDLDFKHNLEQKLKLIGRAEELSQDDDINKAFRELQMLHKMWKEEIGPVAKEHREEVWDKFSGFTKIVHDRRHDLLKEQEKELEANFDKKKQLVEEISQVTSTTKASHQSWQNAIKKVQELRDAYFETGKVPRANNKEIWSLFKEATRHFNREKNAFYKNQKKEQYKNLEQKLELIKIAEANKDSEDFEVVTPLMKKIQNDWKQIGHVPRKDSDKIWKQFKGACNHYFNQLHAQKNEANKEELVHYETKTQLIETLSSFELSGDHKEDLKNIKAQIATWKEIGRVPYNKRNIERKFNKVLDGLFGQLNLGKKETELIKFENKLNSMVSQEDERKLQNEQFFISKKIGETKDEIRQLENNLGFFQDTKSDNPLVKEVHKNIAKHKEQLEVWKAKLSKIKSIQ